MVRLMVRPRSLMLNSTARPRPPPARIGTVNPVKTLRFILPVEPHATVLVVDDNEDTLVLIQRYLTQHHYHAVITNQAEEALRIAAQLQPIAITVDLMMPDIDGWDLLQIFLHQPATQHIPIIVCSVLRQKELALSLGAAAFLEKPVMEEALINLLSSFQQRKDTVL